MSILLLLLLMISFVCCQMTQTMRDFIVSEHNKYKRNALGSGGTDVVTTTTATVMKEFEYDMIAECVAQAYLNTLTGSSFSHNANRNAQYVACGAASGSQVGENWYSGGVGSSDNADSYGGGASRAWVDLKWSGCSERDCYFQTSGCTSCTTGHYTQVVWGNSYKVGCGYTAKWGTLCDYYPPGNYVGQSPFTVGTACSGCSASTTSPHIYCNDRLCSKTNPSAGSAACTTLPTFTTGVSAGTCTSSTASGSSCSLACSSGYTASTTGTFTITCTNGVYSAYTATCSATAAACTTVPTASVAHSTAGTCTTNQASGTTCALACASGYTAAGSLSTTCTAGTFSSIVGTCVANSCATVPTVSNAGAGTCTANQASGTTCSLSCASGYTLTGSLSTTCTLGSWSAITGTCTAQNAACTLPTLGTGVTAGTCSSSQSSGSSCSLSCASGYTQSATGSFALTCTNGAYNSVTATCVAKCSSAPTLPSNVSVGTCGSNVNSGTSCTASCNSGLTLLSGSLTTTCTNGVWSTITGVCGISSGAACTKTPTIPAHGSVGNCVANSASGTTCTLGCATKYKTSGSFSTTCTNGVWSALPSGSKCVKSSASSDTNGSAKSNQVDSTPFIAGIVAGGCVALGAAGYMIYKKKGKSSSSSSNDNPMYNMGNRY